jgi:oligopeptide transport system ATP-binding protein
MGVYPARPQIHESVDPVLQVRDLRTAFRTRRGTVHAVDGSSFAIGPGRTLALVGESGSGKSVTCLSILGLVPSPPGEILGGEVFFGGRDLLRLSKAELRGVRGRGIGMIFQDPLAALNPYLRIGTQVQRALRLHRETDRRRARVLAHEWLERVGISDPGRRLRAFPHEISGGMRQRVMIAMSLACEPQILLADEPTTALDVTVQAQILDLIKDLQQRLQTALLLVSHDLGVVAGTANEVAVMYAGRIVEHGSTEQIFYQPRHPYTLGLRSSIPQLAEREAVAPIPGQPPDLANLPSGCPFRVRCRSALAVCAVERPPSTFVAPGHRVECHLVAPR